MCWTGYSETPPIRTIQTIKGELHIYVYTYIYLYNTHTHTHTHTHTQQTHIHTYICPHTKKKYALLHACVRQYAKKKKRGCSCMDACLSRRRDTHTHATHTRTTPPPPLPKWDVGVCMRASRCWCARRHEGEEEEEDKLCARLGTRGARGQNAVCMQKMLCILMRVWLIRLY